MKVSVIVCEHDCSRLNHFREAIKSLKAQTYGDVEIVAVSDGDEKVSRALRQDYSESDSVQVVCNERNLGLLESRNRGAQTATGDIVAFMDDDALAQEDWVETLVQAYETQETDAVGGKMLPEWKAGQPGFLPKEYWWLIGATYKGFADGAGFVRNTMGSNLSFRRETFLELGGFNTEIGGRKGDSHLQGGETELCARLDKGVYYDPDAIVRHKIFDYRTQLRWLLNRAFWQGYSKRAMSQITPGSTGEERGYLGQLLRKHIPERIKGLVRHPSGEKLAQLFSIGLFTGTVGTGYLYGVIHYR